MEKIQAKREAEKLLKYHESITITSYVGDLVDVRTKNFIDVCDAKNFIDEQPEHYYITVSICEK